MGFTPMGILLIILMGALLFFLLKFLYERLGAFLKRFFDLGVIEKNPANKINYIPLNTKNKGDK